MKTESCELDPIPTNSLKQLPPKCLSAMMQLVNSSLTQGVFNDEWEAVIVRPYSK